MAAVASGSIDFSKQGKYPVVLSDALLGKTSSKDSITAIRYNHKPTPNGSSPGTLNLSPSNDDPTSYDLSFEDQSGRYQYAGSRTSGDGQYVLIFDKVKKHFVLHRVDSTFDMNLVGTPKDQDADSLRSEYGRIDPQPKANPAPKANPPAPKKAAKTAKPAAAKPVAAPKAAPKRQQKVEKPKKKPARDPTPDPEEDDDSDDGLTIEYPDGHAPSRFNFTSTPIFQEAISEASEEDEDPDADGEFEEEGNMDVDHLQLPSPANNGGGHSPEDLEMDLEAELERALESNNGGESDESEEE